MRALRFAVLLLALVAPPAALGARAEEPVSAADRGAIVGIIEAQLGAFQGDRATEAFGYASPMIQQMFGTADNFMEMVRTGYAPVYRPRSVQFDQLVTLPEGLVQKVLLVGPDGVPVMAHYIMQKQPDGSWRINGCTLHDTDDRMA